MLQELRVESNFVLKTEFSSVFHDLCSECSLCSLAHVSWCSAWLSRLVSPTNNLLARLFTVGPLWSSFKTTKCHGSEQTDFAMGVEISDLNFSPGSVRADASGHHQCLFPVVKSLSHEVMDPQPVLSSFFGSAWTVIQMSRYLIAANQPHTGA